ncbi:MAG: methyltransferase domain-containing protein [Thermomicrobiales bacterium]|nr:methyltransferase domain-containing protein [Thermomicrobiales bacterium]
MDRTYSQETMLRLAEAYSESMIPARAQAIQRLTLESGGVGLDVGCGAGVPLLQLAQSMGEGARIVGIDISTKQLELAAERIASAPQGVEIDLLEADATAELPFASDTFDWVWSENAIWGGMIGKRYETITELQRVLKPGGILAFFYGNMYRAMMLPGLPQLEHKLYRADSVRWFGGEPLDPNRSHENAGYWFREAGLKDIHVSTHLAEYTQPLPDCVRDHLQLVWANNFGDELESFALDAGVTPDQWLLWKYMTTPGTKQYLLDQPDFRVMRTATLTTGVKPR